MTWVCDDRDQHKTIGYHKFHIMRFIHTLIDHKPRMLWNPNILKLSNCLSEAKMLSFISSISVMQKWSSQAGSRIEDEVHSRGENRFQIVNDFSVKARHMRSFFWNRAFKWSWFIYRDKAKQNKMQTQMKTNNE